MATTEPVRRARYTRIVKGQWEYGLLEYYRHQGECTKVYKPLGITHEYSEAMERTGLGDDSLKED